MFTAKLIDGIAAFDPSVRGLTVKDCTWRIYRDTRFSPDKTPYKTHMGLSLLPVARKAVIRATISTSNRCGTNAPGRRASAHYGALLSAAGSAAQRAGRILDNGAEIEAAIREAKGFVLDESNKLKRLPKGYAPGSPYDEWLKLKDVYITERLAPEFMLDKELLKNTLHEFRKTKHFRIF